MDYAAVAAFSGVAGVCLGLVAAFFFPHAEVQVPQAGGPKPAVPPAARPDPLATLPTPLHVSDIEVPRPTQRRYPVTRWALIDTVNGRRMSATGVPAEVPVPDEERRVEVGDEDYPHDGGAQTTVWARGPLTEQAAALGRRFIRAVRAEQHPGWEDGHLHELRGAHGSGETADLKPRHRPAHSSEGDTVRLPAGSVARATGRAA